MTPRSRRVALCVLVVFVVIHAVPFAVYGLAIVLHGRWLLYASGEPGVVPW